MIARFSGILILSPHQLKKQQQNVRVGPPLIKRSGPAYDAHGHNTVPPLRLKPATIRSQIEQSNTARDPKII